MKPIPLHERKPPMLSDMGATRLSFSGHETFAFRYGWLWKGVNLAAEDPTAFFREEAVSRLGVGKNMVASIRHWCEVLGLIGMDGRLRNGWVRDLGSALFRDDGLDPFLEHHGTLWLLHWQLCRGGSRATTWHYAFTRWNKAVFTREDLVSWLLKVVQDIGDAKTSRASLKRDVDVFLRTYVPAKAGPTRAPEDSLDCPLTELGLIREVEPGTYQFQRRVRLSLPPAVLAFALSDYWQWSAPEQRTLSFERVMYGPGSPGGAFQLTEAGMTEILTRLPRSAGFVLDESAGMRRVARWSLRPTSLDELLNTVYRGVAV